MPLLLRDRPNGSCPLSRENVYGVVPPLAAMLAL